MDPEPDVPAWAFMHYDKWYSYEIEPGVRASCLCKRKNGGLVDRPDNAPDMVTIWALFKNGLALSQHGKCFGWRDGDTFKWWSFQEVYDRIRALAGALACLPRQSGVGIYSVSKANWMIVSLAASSRSLFFVPLYDTLGAESCNYIINQVEMSLLFIDTLSSAKRVLANAASTPSIQTIVMFNEPDEELIKMAQERGIKLASLDKFTEETRDIASEVAFDEPKTEDLAAVFYTSGTTGDPKGVMHTHRSLSASVTCGIEEFFVAGIAHGNGLTKEDVCLHYMPLAHVYGYVIAGLFIYHGAATAFFSGNVAKLTEDATILKPTFLPLVPRLMSRVYGKVLAGLSESRLKSALFWFAYNRKLALLRQGYMTRASVWDKLVFNKVQALIGGRVRAMSVGSAPVSREIMEFFRVVFGAMICEGYGQTETAGCVTFAAGPDGGNVGMPTACSYVKLVDAPECGYHVKDGKGEICVKGVNMMSGYYKMPEKTVEAVDADGWLHSGDIGEFLPDGSLRVIDRKKHIFKLAQGEYIAPEKVEGFYLLCPEILQVFVDGNSLEPYLIAIAVPEPSQAAHYAEKNGLDPATVHLDLGFRKHIIEALREVGKANKLNSLEQVKTIHLTNVPFTFENGLLTPTMKNKRADLRKYYKETIDALYKAGPIVGGESS